MAQSKKAGLIQGAEESDVPVAERAVLVAGSDYGTPARKRTVKVSSAGIVSVTGTFTGTITGTVDQGLKNGGGAAAWYVQGTVDQGLKNGGAAASWYAQGADAEGAAATAAPLATGAKDASGNIQPFRSAVMADVNATLSPAVTAQRILADLQVQDAVGNLTNRVRSGRDLAGGIVGSTAVAVGSSVYDSAAALFRARLGDASGREIVVGAASSGSAVAGAPVLQGISDGTNAQTVKQQVNSTTGIAGTGVPMFAPMLLTSGGNICMWVDATRIADSTAGNNEAAVATSLYNGAAWDRQRSNVDVTLLASASRGTTQTSADITTYNLSGIIVVLDMTTIGTASVTVTINGKDPASAKYYLLLAGVAITSNSTNRYVVRPGATVTANVSANEHLPRIIQIVVTANNANAGTYSVGYTLLT